MSEEATAYETTIILSGSLLPFRVATIFEILVGAVIRLETGWM